MFAPFDFSNPWYKEATLTLRVQVPNYHILTQDLYYNYYYPKPKYLIIRYLDPLGKLQTQTQILLRLGVRTVSGFRLYV